MVTAISLLYLSVSIIRLLPTPVTFGGDKVHQRFRMYFSHSFSKPGSVICSDESISDFLVKGKSSVSLVFPYLFSINITTDPERPYFNLPIQKLSRLFGTLPALTAALTMAILFESHWPEAKVASPSTNQSMPSTLLKSGLLFAWP